jgi:hypothetical protein
LIAGISGAKLPVQVIMHRLPPQNVQSYIYRWTVIPATCASPRNVLLNEKGFITVSETIYPFLRRLYSDCKLEMGIALGIEE